MLSSMQGLSRKQRWLLGLGFVVVILLVWFFWLRQPEAKRPPPPNPWMGPTPVHTVSVIKEDLTLRLKALGTVTPLNTVTLRSRVSGPLVEVLFREGQPVKAGDLLAVIDPQPYKVGLAQAEGTVQQTAAQLKSAEEDLRLYERLLKQNSIAKQQYDKQVALVDQLRGTLKTHEAQREDARLQLGYTRITAPITGRTGLRQVDIGNLVNAGDSNGLVTITQTHPITVVFTIPENQLMAVRQAHHQALASQQPLVVEAWDRSEQQLLASGQLTTLDNQIDTATGTLRLRAEFDNSDDSLFPNQFVNARLQVQTVKDALTIPADAVQYGSKGAYVYVIDAEGKARMRRITLGVQEDQRIAVTEGLSEGEQVVLEGIDRLWEGKDAKVIEQEEPAAESGKPQ
ncbi:MdtA/MuxA family multidrug efflux RND transporter periplasmic adaptor subunit [Cellvibrio japonicus]|uniref:HlyD family secretion protein n=1 Tax=Cellvibrio japonicus (strain Ueda107) TaxID=498211 RepID=B3PI34_CELJU|nr:MdtA/MuxA family multidrug efflux RND transporter periplasmic adaptor subunit [Cellvibrio japonicus]ACE84396.1 HlyD family secretion protein [Cellvibrio japonicus Ueda107]QEI11085.1 MdtA/MuxA family multidrug efflux RND transporter periplasmic adaptor subunit [Cellvibrio japonicus]QEI14659.1 MdtA/MuxA family multidrug efflux RND transporter periplasmic adaptor subunit [Cellvibrio japonicus]QEI18239.1 MdtA/MuxA family multidrug efflux RND transporter periplasmic adaptor subunit [Cellvibrio ja